ncbi:uncharacterized protein [Rutidosis leptorrhynchoides]|uniref:uncharacterized protein n=1 Tax=Rutidosis leptorrhynchoides TaxID=125765 RepID=UPI003A990C6D
MPQTTSLPDDITWLGLDNVPRKFSVNQVWDSIRPRSICVNWFRIVWYSQCVSKHAFLLWILMGERLKTQDKLKSWEIHNVPLFCPLCKLRHDSHDHLFSECIYANKVWKKAVAFTCLPMVSNWKVVCNYLMPTAGRNTVNMVVAKLVFGAVVYAIWQERNNRLFKKFHHSKVKLFEDVFSTVRLKLMSIKFKNSAKVERMKTTWQL